MSGGVRFVGGDNRDNVIENNYVHHVGEGIYVRNSAGDVIRHNLIHDVDREWPQVSLRRTTDRRLTTTFRESGWMGPTVMGQGFT